MTAPTPGPVQPSTIGGAPFPGGHPTCAPAFCHHGSVLVTPAPVQPSTIGGRPYPGHPTCAPAFCRRATFPPVGATSAAGHRAYHPAATVAVPSRPDPLAHTGADVGALAGAGGGLVLAGAVLLAWGRRTIGRRAR